MHYSTWWGLHGHLLPMHYQSEHSHGDLNTRRGFTCCYVISWDVKEKLLYKARTSVRLGQWALRSAYQLTVQSLSNIFHQTITRNKCPYRFLCPSPGVPDVGALDVHFQQVPRFWFFQAGPEFGGTSDVIRFSYCILWENEDRGVSVLECEVT